MLQGIIKISFKILCIFQTRDGTQVNKWQSINWVDLLIYSPNRSIIAPYFDDGVKK